MGMHGSIHSVELSEDKKSGLIVNKNINTEGGQAGSAIVIWNFHPGLGIEK